MKVYKFGGTSVGSAERMAHVASLINDGDPKVVVLSAMSGTTNALVAINDAFHADNVHKGQQLISELESKYYDVVKELYKNSGTALKANEFIKEKFAFMRSLDVEDFGNVQDKTMLAQGELISTQLFQFYLEENGVRSALLPALNFMRTDRMNEPDLYYIKENLKREIAPHGDCPLFITQGYICVNAWGEVSNLQRGGSDYTATLIGAALKADDIQIWTDIDGLHNNDPRFVGNTKPVKQLSYKEAEELAFFGAKILHPLCVIPAHHANVPVWLKNTMDPKAHGTFICSEAASQGVKAVAAKDNITAIKIQSARMMMAYGFLRRIFEIFERYQTPIDMITTSEVAVSLTIEDDSKLQQIVEELRQFGKVSVDKNQTIVSVVGENITNDPNSMDLFVALKNYPVRMISYGGSRNNISVLIDSSAKKEVLQGLSDHLFA